MNELLSQIIGMEKQAAIDFLQSHKYEFRISSIDGVPMIVTRDLHENRVNLSLKDNKVIRFVMG